MPNPMHAMGERAELAGASWLAGRGWTILARRWRCAAGELDLVALDPDGLLVAVEVKVRSTDRAGSPLESIDRVRLRRLRAALGRYLAEMPVASQGIRVDLLALHPNRDGQWRISHLPGIDAW